MNLFIMKHSHTEKRFAVSLRDSNLTVYPQWHIPQEQKELKEKNLEFLQ